MRNKFSSALVIFMVVGNALSQRVEAQQDHTPSIQTAETPKLKPYGAAHIVDTDLKKLRSSILKQMHDAGISRPRRFNIFPEKSDYAPSVGGKHVVGVAKEGFDKYELFQFDLPDYPACKALVIKDPFIAFRILVGLHETVHYILEQLEKKGPPETPRIGSLDPKREIAQTDETRADLGSLIYIFSNYGDKTENALLLKKTIDYREALYFDWNHSSDDILQKNAAYLTNSLPKGLTIFQAAALAKQIVPLIQIQKQQMQEEEAIERFMVDDPMSYMVLRLLPEKSINNVADKVPRIVAARNRACGLGSVSLTQSPRPQ